MVDCSRQMVRQHGSCVDRSALLSFGAQRVLRSWLTSASHGPRQMHWTTDAVELDRTRTVVYVCVTTTSNFLVYGQISHRYLTPYSSIASNFVQDWIVHCAFQSTIHSSCYPVILSPVKRLTTSICHVAVQ